MRALIGCGFKALQLKALKGFAGFCASLQPWLPAKAD